MFLAFGMFSCNARADIFVFDALSSPVTDEYYQVGTPQFQTGTPPYVGNEDMFHWPFPFPGFDIEAAEFSNNQAPSGTYSYRYFSAVDGSPFSCCGSQSAMYIDDSAGNTDAVMLFQCGPSSNCELYFISAIGGGPLDLQALAQSGFGFSAAIPAKHIVATGGLQDAVDAEMIGPDGLLPIFDNFEFVLTPAVPEPLSLVLLATILVGLGVRARLKLRAANS